MQRFRGGSLRILGLTIAEILAIAAYAGWVAFWATQGLTERRSIVINLGPAVLMALAGAWISLGARRPFWRIAGLVVTAVAVAVVMFFVVNLDSGRISHPLP